MRSSAERFFRKAINASHNSEPNGFASYLGAGNPPMTRSFSPRVINVDKNAAYPKAVDDLKADETLTQTTELRPVKYLNNIVELFAPIHQTIGQPRNGVWVIQYRSANLEGLRGNEHETHRAKFME